MSQSKKDKKNGFFSFDRDPGKLDGGDTDAEFTFSDVPVLGKSGKEKDKSGSFSFEELKTTAGTFPSTQEKSPGSPSADSEPESFELLSSNEKSNDENLQENQPDSAETEARQIPDDNYGKDSVEKWRTIFIPGGKKKYLRIAVVAGILLAVIFSAGIFFMFFAKSSSTRTASQQNSLPAGRTASVSQRGAKAEEEEKKRKMEQLANELTAAELLFGENKFEEALKSYQQILERDYRKSYILFKIGESYKNLSQNEKALEFLEKSIVCGTEDSKPYAAIVVILNKQEKYTEALSFIEKCKEKYPSDTGTFACAAETFYFLNKPDDSLQCFKKISRAELSQKQFEIYAGLLLKKSQKNEAKEVYLDAFYKFGNFDLLNSALKLIDKNDDKIAILRRVVESAQKENAAKRTYCSVMLAEALDKGGEKNEMAEILNQIDASVLTPEMSIRFLKLLFSGSSKIELVESGAKKIIIAHQSEIPMLEKFQDIILSLGPKEYDELRLKIFADLMNKNSSNPTFLYLYGRALGASFDTAKIYFEKAVKVNPAFYEAQYSYGNILIQEKDWNGAAKVFRECSIIRPEDSEARYLLSMCKIKSGHIEEGYNDYRKYFQENLHLPASKTAEKLITLAQLLPSSKRAEECLSEMGKNPELKKKYDLEKIRTNFIYGELTDADFASGYAGETREYYILYLLSKGRSKEVLMLKTPPSDFPEFWKVFLCWRDNLPSWSENAELLRKKNNDSKNPIYRIITSIWQNKLSPEEARGMANRIPAESEALFYFILAEKYRKDKNLIKAKICYTKAKNDKQNPFYRVIEYYSRDLQ